MTRVLASHFYSVRSNFKNLRPLDKDWKGKSRRKRQKSHFFNYQGSFSIFLVWKEFQDGREGKPDQQH